MAKAGEALSASMGFSLTEHRRCSARRSANTEKASEQLPMRSRGARDVQELRAAASEMETAMKGLGLPARAAQTSRLRRPGMREAPTRSPSPPRASTGGRRRMQENIDRFAGEGLAELRAAGARDAPAPCSSFDALSKSLEQRSLARDLPPGARGRGDSPMRTAFIAAAAALAAGCFGGLKDVPARSRSSIASDAPPSPAGAPLAADLMVVVPEVAPGLDGPGHRRALAGRAHGLPDRDSLGRRVADARAGGARSSRCRSPAGCAPCRATLGRFRATHTLVVEVRRFEADYTAGGLPVAQVALAVTLGRAADRRVLAAFTASAAGESGGREPADGSGGGARRRIRAGFGRNGGQGIRSARDGAAGAED